MRRAASESSTLDPATKLAYGVGALGDSIKTFCFTSFLLFYYTTVLGLPGILLGLAMALGLVWDAVVDPLIGHASDRATYAFGRRHSFMLVGALGAGASFIAVFNPPSGISIWALFIWLMVSSLGVRSSNSLFMVPYSALGAELTADYHERTSIAGYRAAAVLVGTLLATAAAFLVFLPNQTAGEAGSKFARGSYMSMGLAFGLVITVVGLVATFGTVHERRRIAGPAVASGGELTFRRNLLGTLRDSSFRVLVASSSLSFMASAINAALSLHFLTYHARIAAGNATWLYFGGFYGGALSGVLVWVHVTKRVEKHHVYALTTMVTAVVMSSGYWLVGEGRLFGTGDVSALVFLSALTGFFGIAASVTAPSMMADITARDEVHHGRRRDGAFFGIYSFGQQMSSGIAILIAGLLVDRFAGLVPGQPEQSATTIARLPLISNVLPALILAASGLLALQYRLTRREAQSIQRELTESAAAGVTVIPAGHLGP